MNIWNHCNISVRKFGGIENDYFEVHKFVDSSKLFYFNVKHRLLLHNLYGVDVGIKKFGDTLTNSNGEVLLVRDIIAEHLKEDLSGQVPSLNEWLIGNDEEISKLITIPKFVNRELEEFVLMPMIMSNLKSSLLITLSDFGIYLTNEILGTDYAKELMGLVEKEKTVKSYLEQFRFSKRWQYSPDRKELEWLKNKNDGQHTTT